MKKVKLFLVLISLIIFQFSQSACSEIGKSTIEDTIPNINLEFQTEKEIVMSDLFYSENYNLEFAENNDINIEYNKESNSIKLKSKSDFVGITLVKFLLNGITYNIDSIIRFYYKDS